MMDTLRRYAKGWASQLLLVILVLSFAVWGVSDFFTGFQQNTIAQVGSTEISATDFQRNYDLEVRRLSQQLGTPLTQEMARQFGVPQQVLARLISQATLQEAATNLGLGLSDQALAQRIAHDPRFQGSTGVFDRGLLSQIIRGMGLTEDEFIVQTREEYTRGQLGDALANGTLTPETFVRAFQQYRDEQRDVSYIVLTAPPVEDVREPSESDIAAFWEENDNRWDVPELRSFIYATLSADAIASPEDVTDAEARARYDASAARFSTVERRQIQQIVFPTRVEAEAAAAALSSGKTFDDIVTERGLASDDIDLGFLTREQVIDKTIADVAFALEANTTSAIVDTAFGPAIVRVTTIEPAVVTPFDEVEDDLKAEIARERAATEITAIHDAVEDARAGGDGLADIADRYGLDVATVDGVDAQGRDEDGDAIEGLPQAVVTAVFESGVGLADPPVEPSRGTYIWYDLNAIADTRGRELSEVREQVVEAWKQNERQDLLDDEAQDILRSLEGNVSLSDIAAMRGIAVQRARGITRTTSPAGALSAQAIAAIFDADEGRAITAAGAEPLTALVARIDNVATPAFDPTAASVAQARQQFDPQYLSDLLGLYISELQKKTDVRINQAVFQQVLGLTVAN